MSGGPLPFKTPDVPILGQPLELKSWFPTALIVCKCAPVPTPVLIVGEAPAVCSSCKKAYVIGSVEHTHGQPPKIVIGIVTGTKAQA